MFKLILTFAIFLFSFAAQTHSFKPETFVSFVYFVSEDSQTTLENIKTVYQESTFSATIQDWIITPNILSSATTSGYLKKISEEDKNQQLGLYIDLGESQYLDKLSVEKRKEEIDKQLSEFFNIFGYYPKTVSATTIDSKSLSHLSYKYSALSFVYLPGHHPQVPSEAGGYLHAPFIPSSKNHYQPSRSVKDRLPIIISTGLYLTADTAQEQIDFLSQKKFNEFTQITIAKDIDSSKVLPKTEVKSFLSQVKSFSSKHSINQKSLAYFSDWYLARYPESTPAFFYERQANQGKEFVYQNPWYRVTLSQRGPKVYLDSFYTYNQSLYEPAYTTASPGEPGIQSLNKVAKTDQLLTLTEPNLYLNYLRQFDYWQVTLQNQNEKIILRPKEILFENLNPESISSKNVAIKTKGETTTWPVSDKQNNKLTLLLFLALVVCLIVYFFKGPGKPPFTGLLLVIVAGFVSFRSGGLYPFGLGFWGPHGHDAIFHLSLIESFTQNLGNFSHPQVINQFLGNYHLFFDYFSALLVSLTSLPLLDYYFIVFPLLSGVVIVLLLNQLFSKLNLTSFQKKISFLLIFFGSSLGFLTQLLQGKNIFHGESVFWSNQSLSMFLNPPFLLSIVFLLAFLVIYSQQSKTKKSFLLLVIFGGLLAQTKVYAFILLVLGLLWKKELRLSFFVGLLGLAISLPFSTLSGSPFIFEPLWFVRTMIESNDRLYLKEIANAWQSYEASGQFAKIFLLNIFFLFVFLVGNLGLRCLGLVKTFTMQIANDTDDLIRKIIYLALLLPLFFVQSVNPWNSIQFFYYGLFFLALYTSTALPKKAFPLILLLFMGTFGSVGTIKDYLTTKSSSRISHQELQVLRTLESLPKGIVLTPGHTGRTTMEAPQPLYDYVSSAYVSAITGQKEYLADTINLSITGIDFATLQKDQSRFFATKDVVWARDFLVKNNIKYVLETPKTKMSINPADIGLSSHFNSGEVKLYILN